MTAPLNVEQTREREQSIRAYVDDVRAGRRVASGPLGALCGRAPQTVQPGGSVAWRATPEVRRHRRSTVERLELVAAGFGGALALALMIFIEKKVTGRG